MKDSIYENAFRHRHGVRWVLAFVVAIIVLVLYEFDIFGRFELMSLDYRFILRHPNIGASPIVFIDMGEDSIEAIGRWPWPRKWHATLIKILSEYNANAVALDVLFSEPQDAVDDTALAEAMRQVKFVYLPILYNLKVEDTRYAYSGYGISSVMRQLPAFEKEAKGTGHINTVPDLDGILRRVPAIIKFKDAVTYQFGLKMGLDMLGIKDRDISFYPRSHFILARMPGDRVMKIPLDDYNELVINWQAKWGKEFRHYSYIDIIHSYAQIKEGKAPIIDLSGLKNKICIVGLTASGLIDIKPIPIQNIYPAVGINAMILNSVLKNDFLHILPKRYNILIIILMSIFVTLYLSNFRLLGGMLMSIITIAAYSVISIAIFSFFSTAILTFYPILAVFLSYSLTSLYTQVIQSVERARLFKQATRDGLTYLYNIRHFNLLFEAEFRNAFMYKSRRLSIVMADIDNFKHINDTYGHQAGDTILREFARTIQSKCREVDVIARYGGEEFIVMLTGAGEKEAFDIAEKIRLAVEARRFKFKSETYHTTISAGVAEFSGEKNKDDLIEKADKALYKAKHEGKNRVCPASSVNAGTENAPPYTH
ncbi:MAG: diguanylate cyclase [Candidatus Omnitrophica bacterium]|nr:diguanylate cyclase [Candidatus Omnitrophota bacterium]